MIDVHDGTAVKNGIEVNTKIIQISRNLCCQNLHRKTPPAHSLLLHKHSHFRLVFMQDKSLGCPLWSFHNRNKLLRYYAHYKQQQAAIFIPGIKVEAYTTGNPKSG